MRRLAPLLALVLGLFPLSPAVAQDIDPVPEARVELSLLRQTPWNEPRRPLQVAVLARNVGTVSLRELTLAVTVADRVGSRSAYALSLSADATPALSIRTTPIGGALRAGESRRIEVEEDLAAVLRQAGRHATGVYPVTVELRSEGLAVARLRTPAVYLSREPEQPLNLAWTFVLHVPVTYGPDGLFLTPAVERSVAVGAPLSAEIGALSSMLGGPRAAPVDIVVSPPLLDQLIRMRGGYRVQVGPEVAEVQEGQAGAADASRILGRIRTIAGSELAEVAAMPFAAPELPALIRADVPGDFREQLQRGWRAVEELAGTAPNPRLFYPPDGVVDQHSLGRLSTQGIRVLLLDSDDVEVPAQERGFAPPPVVRVALGGGRTLTAVVPDPGLTALLGASLVRDDPRLGAQAVLGELAAIWLEQPGEIRGTAILIPADAALPPRFFGPFVRGVVRAPWLRPVKASGIGSRVPPPDRPVQVTPGEVGEFSAQYAARLRDARALIRTYRSVLVEESPVPEELTTLVLTAEAGVFVRLEAVGGRFLDEVEERVRATFRLIGTDPSGVVTLTSRTGVIPVGVTNETGQPIRVRVRLSSPRLRFVGGSVQEVELDQPARTLTFRVETQTTGRFPVDVRIETPSGEPLASGELVVRSTAYSRVALFITMGAALFLLARWGRRFLPRTRT
ncbi:MAG: hypothetical protein HY658_04825 [Actinobacteria bacterium]|nr:hypothetical protein [Actinomycetota bacterium]